MILEPLEILRIKPEWGDVNQIQTVRHYNDLRLGIKPVVSGCNSWDSDPTFPVYDIRRHPHAKFTCPECFLPHIVYIDNETGCFLGDSNYCVCCLTEFCFHDDSEFDLYVKPE